MRDLAVSDRDRWLLEACLRDDPDAVARAYSDWRPFANPTLMRGRDLRLMPALTANLRRSGINDPDVAWLRGQAKHVWLTGALRVRAFERVLDLLATAAIPVVLLKGAALLVRWRHESDGRPMGDFDVLVPIARVREALAVLHGAGHGGAVPGTVSNHDLARYHAFGCVDPAGNNTDLHWRPAEAIHDPAFGEGLMARSICGLFGTRRVRVPCLADHLFLLLAHAGHDTIVRRNDWCVEAALLLRGAREEDWDWRLFASLCARYGLTDWVRKAFSLLADMSDRPLAEGAMAHLSGPGPDRNVQPSRPVMTGLDPADSVELSFPDGARFSVRFDEVARVGPHGFDLGHHPPGASLLSGWSVPDVDGRWTDGDAAYVALRIPGGRVGDNCILRWFSHPYAPAAAGGLEVQAWAGADPSGWRLDAEAPEPLWRSVDGQIQDCGGEALLLVTWRMTGTIADPEAIAELALDQRVLGLFVRRIDVLLDCTLPVLRHRLAFNTEASDAPAWIGWGEREPTGRWTVGAEAQIRLRLPAEPRRRIRGFRVTIGHVMARSASGQTIRVALNGTAVLTTVFRGAASGSGVSPGGDLDIDVSDDISLARGLLDIRLHISDPVSPQSIGLSQDSRPLALFVTAIETLYR